MIHLNDLFHTVQGEGANVGRRALFVRMPYCNLSCSWCDTSFNSYNAMRPEEFLAFALKEPTRFAVITGGEPTMHKHTPEVVTYLKSLGFHVAIETNGHFPIPNGVDWVCCSPKREAFMQREPYYVNPTIFSCVNEFKYVVDDGFEFGVLDRHNGNDLRAFAWDSKLAPRLWLSPEHTNWKQNVARILAYTAQHPQWRLNLQTHKLIGVP